MRKLHNDFGEMTLPSGWGEVTDDRIKEDQMRYAVFTCCGTELLIYPNEYEECPVCHKRYYMNWYIIEVDL